MDFEFAPLKSKANQGKHGIDLVNAQALWNDPDLLEIPARKTGEPRFPVIAQIHGKHWSVVITHRSQAIRLISVRRSRLEEVQLYEQL